MEGSAADPGDGQGAQASKLSRLGAIAAAPLAIVPLAFVGVYSLITTAPESLARIGGKLNTAAGFRDGFLLLVAAAYGVGYLVWSLHAWQDELGLLPALRFQYIFAGLFPLAFAWVVFHALRGLAFIGRLGVPAGIGVSLLMIGGSIAIAAFVIPPYVGRWGLIVYVVLTAIVFVSGPMFGAIGFLRAAIPWVGATVVVVATALYVTVIYPAIPQELGGVKPRCVRLEVKKADLSASAQSDLVPTNEDDAVVQTRPLSLLFATRDFYIVRTRPDDTETTYRVSSGTVLGTVGC